MKFEKWWSKYHDILNREKNKRAQKKYFYQTETCG